MNRGAHPRVFIGRTHEDRLTRSLPGPAEVTMLRQSAPSATRALAWSDAALLGFAMAVWIAVPLLGLALQAVW